MTDDNSNKEKEVQDVGDEDIMYEPLLRYMNVETLMDEDENGRRVTRRAARRRAGGFRPRTSEEEQVEGRSRHELTVRLSCHLRLCSRGPPQSGTRLVIRGRNDGVEAKNLFGN